MILAALRAHLAADTTISGLVGTKIYGDDAPQDAVFPCVVMHLISNQRMYLLDGPNGQAQARVQVDCWAETKLAAIAIAEAVRVAVENVRFNYGAAIVGPTRLDGERDLESLLQQVPQARGRAIDLLIWTSE